MACKSEEVSVDGRRYILNQYTAGKAVKLLARIAKVIGKPIALITGGGMGKEMTGEILATAVDALTQNLEPDDLDKMIRDILEGTLLIDGNKNKNVVAIFDIEFAGELGHLFNLLKEVLKFQYSDFLAVTAVATQGLTARTEEPKQAIRKVQAK